MKEHKVVLEKMLIVITVMFMLTMFAYNVCLLTIFQHLPLISNM